MTLLLALLAMLSIWDYPSRFPEHDRLRRQFVVALREGDTATMEETCRKGTKLLPDDPTWHYNLACSLAYFPKRVDEAFDELEKAIDLGFRDCEAIRNDTDLRRIADRPRFAELVEYADAMKTRPLLTGPQAWVDQTGVFGKPISLGEANLSWDFDVGAFVAHLKLAPGVPGEYVGELYMNRDGGHSMLDVERYPGITVVKLDSDGRERGMDVNAPNLLFPYPVFGNCSRAFVGNPFWRSMPRALTTINVTQLASMMRFYLDNQIWVFPANEDIAPVGTNGDVFASITPYWITTAGRSFSDLPYLRAALSASRALKPEVRQELVRLKLLAPTLQTLIRKSLNTVSNETDYLSAKAHPTAMPPNGLDLGRLQRAASSLTTEKIPPLAMITVRSGPVASQDHLPELLYGTAFAWSYVLRADDEERTFLVEAKGAQEFAFVHTHGSDAAKVRIERTAPDAARITLLRSGLNPTNRVDVAVFGRNSGTEWGAPSYISFARMDPKAPYSDPALTPLEQPAAK